MTPDLSHAQCPPFTHLWCALHLSVTNASCFKGDCVAARAALQLCLRHWSGGRLLGYSLEMGCGVSTEVRDDTSVHVSDERR